MSTKNAANTEQKSRRTGWGLSRLDLVFLVVIAASIVVVMNLRTSSAPAQTPALFAQHLTLPAATETSAETGKPVLVYATASWCGPCQSFKRGALSDPEVEKVIVERTLPVYLDIDKEREAASRLGVMSIPRMIVLRDNQVVAQHVGVMSSAQTIAFINEHAGPASNGTTGISSGD